MHFVNQLMPTSILTNLPEKSPLFWPCFLVLSMVGQYPAPCGPPMLQQGSPGDNSISAANVAVVMQPSQFVTPALQMTDS